MMDLTLAGKIIVFLFGLLVIAALAAVGFAEAASQRRGWDRLQAEKAALARQQAEMAEYSDRKGAWVLCMENIKTATVWAEGSTLDSAARVALVRVRQLAQPAKEPS